MKTKNLGPSLATGIMWSSSLSQGKPLRDQTNQDELSRFEWIRHDGKRFGIQHLHDSSYDMHLNTSFVVPERHEEFDDKINEPHHVPEWFQKITIGPANSIGSDVNIYKGDDKKSLMFYLGTECAGNDVSECLVTSRAHGWKVNTHKGSKDRGFDSAVSVVGYSEPTGWFCMFLIVKQQQPGLNVTEREAFEAPSVSFTGLSDTDLLRGVDRVKSDAKLFGFGGSDDAQSTVGTRRRQKQLRAVLFDDFGDLNNEADDQTSFVAIHVGFSGNVRIDTLLYTHLDANVGDDLSGLIDQAESQGRVNVLPFAFSTELTVSHRSLARISVPTGSSTARSSAVVDPTGEATTNSPQSPIIEPTASASGDVDRTLPDEAKAVAKLECANHGECIRKEVDGLLEDHLKAFDDHFRVVFPFESTLTATTDGTSAAEEGTGFTENDIEVAKVCLSSLLGGMGYFQGRPSIGVAADIELDSGDRAMTAVKNAKQLMKAVNDKSSLLSLLTSTPSRTSFPRGFLWDEGFHQMLISQWSPALSLEVIGSWLRTMHFPCSGKATDKTCVGGWIPREMILGEDAKRRVPDEFVVQRVNIANPPTFLLVIDSMLTRFQNPTPTPRKASPRATGTDLFPVSEELKVEEVAGDRELMKKYTRKTIDPRDAQLILAQHEEDREAVLSTLRDLYPLLHRWVKWFLHSQKGSEVYPGSFRWRGRSQDDGKVIPNTLASGLDDYPRAPVPSANEHHVDLHCWMTKATAIMARLETVLEDTGYALPPESKALALMADYQQQHEYLLQRLDDLHWSAEHNGYFDVGINNEESYFSKELVFRCSNPRDQSTKDVSVPIDVIQQRKQDFCPNSHPKPLFALGDGQGGYKFLERLVMENPVMSHIPRVGYVSLFPLLLKLVDPYSPRLGALLDMVEDPQKLWTDHGLRSLAVSDKFYQRRNADGDAPYWRNVMIMCHNAL